MKQNRLAQRTETLGRRVYFSNTWSKSVPTCRHGLSCNVETAVITGVGGPNCSKPFNLITTE